MDTEKLLHAETSLIITLVIGLFLGWLAGVLVALLAGIGKEIYDKVDYGVFDNGDLIADIVGVVIGLVIVLLV